jgi:HNH endonuclease
MASNVSGARAVQMRRLAAWYRRKNPLCIMCAKRGIVKQTEICDHIIKHNGDPALMLDVNNLQPLCKECHDGSKQTIERRGYSKEIGADGWPIDANHPANKRKKYSSGGIENDPDVFDPSPAAGCISANPVFYDGRLGIWKKWPE